MFRIYKVGKALQKGMHFCHYFEYYLKDSVEKLETRWCSIGLYSFYCLSALQPFAVTVLSLIQLPYLVLHYWHCQNTQMKVFQHSGVKICQWKEC